MKAIKRITDNDIIVVKRNNWPGVLAEMNEEQIRCIKAGQSMREKWIAMRDHPDWKEQWKYSKDPSIKVDSRTSERGNNTFKVSGHVDYPPWIVFRVLNDPKYRDLYDTNIKSVKILTKIAMNTYLMQITAKGKATVSDRDFVVINYNTKTNDNVFMNVNFSDEKYEK